MAMVKPVLEPAAKICAGRKENCEVVEPGSVTRPRLRAFVLGEVKKRLPAGTEQGIAFIS
jgi:hypothetical protein